MNDINRREAIWWVKVTEDIQFQLIMPERDCTFDGKPSKINVREVLYPVLRSEGYTGQILNDSIIYMGRVPTDEELIKQEIQETERGEAQSGVLDFGDGPSPFNRA